MLPSSSIDDVLRVAYAHHRDGRLADAELLYRQILARQPAHADARISLGALALQAGRHDDAWTHFERVIRSNPRDLSTRLTVGQVLHVHDALDDAGRVYRAALELFPGNDEICYRLGHIERKRGDLPAAVGWFRRALAARPNFPEALANLGLALQEAGQPAEAVEQLERALRAEPGRPEVHYNLGVSLASLGRLDDAAAAYRRAAQLHPGFAEAYNNLGAVAKALGKLDEATGAFETALRIQPTMVAAQSNVAGVYEWQARHDDALAAHRRAIALALESPGAYGNCLFSLLFNPSFDAAALRLEHVQWNRRHGQALSRSVERHGNDRTPARRLRVGYVCGLFRDHVLGRYLLPLLRAHDRAQVELVCYSNNNTSDALTSQFRALADAWRDIAPLSDEAAATLIRGDAIDILVDTSLHMEGNRLLVFARKPAPVQVTFAGYPGSTGLDAIGYRLTDVHLDPPGTHDEAYVEESWRLPETFWCYDPLDAEVQVNELPADSNKHVTFGCLNNFSKTNASMWDLWARVLDAVPGSRLLVLAHEGSHRGRALKLLAERGIDDARIEFVGYRPRAEYLSLFHRIDASLDTVPYNGHTTSLDSLWMGVPVVTLVGATVVGRAGVSQLRNLGLPELIAHTADEYVATAVNLAGDLARLRELRRSLRMRMERSPLMNAVAFAANIEAAYRAMWRRWCSEVGAAER